MTDIEDNHSTATLRHSVKSHSAAGRDSDACGKEPVRSTVCVSIGSFLESAANFGENDGIAARALASFKSSVDSLDAPFALPALKSWIVAMLKNGWTYSTQKRYLGKIHALYSAIVGEPSNEMFAAAAALLSKENTTAVCPTEDIDLIRRAAIKPASSNSSFVLYLRLFLFCLYNGGEDMKRAIELIRGESGEWCPQAQKIMSECSSTRRKYVFALDQSRKSEKTIIADTCRKIEAVLRSIGVRLNGEYTPSTAADIWIEVARQCGISDDVIAAIAGKSTELPSYLKLAEPALLSNECRYETLCRVADFIHDSAEKWFAMNLRGNSPAVIEQRLHSDEDCPVKKLHTFYPCETVTVKNGRKRSHEVKPVIPEILFFKTRPELVKPIFRSIGDLAWCYRTNPANPQSPYSTINSRQMEMFQKYVGQFTGDIEINIVNCPVMPCGQKVRITGGIMEGYEGTIIDSSVDCGNLRTFGIRLASDSALTWKVDIDERFIEPIKQ